MTVSKRTSNKANLKQLSIIFVKKWIDPGTERPEFELKMQTSRSGSLRKITVPTLHVASLDLTQFPGKKNSFKYYKDQSHSDPSYAKKYEVAKVSPKTLQELLGYCYLLI